MCIGGRSLQVIVVRLFGCIARYVTFLQCMRGSGNLHGSLGVAQQVRPFGASRCDGHNSAGSTVGILGTAQQEA
jgi:hypothetical protein